MIMLGRLCDPSFLRCFCLLLPLSLCYLSPSLLSSPFPSPSPSPALSHIACFPFFLLHRLGRIVASTHSHTHTPSSDDRHHHHHHHHHSHSLSIRQAFNYTDRFLSRPLPPSLAPVPSFPLSVSLRLVTSSVTFSPYADVTSALNASPTSSSHRHRRHRYRRSPRRCPAYGSRRSCCCCAPCSRPRLLLLLGAWCLLIVVIKGVK